MATTNTWHHDLNHVVTANISSNPSTSNPLPSSPIHTSLLNTSSSSPWTSTSQEHHHISSSQNLQDSQEAVLSDFFRLSLSDGTTQPSSTDLISSYDLSSQHYSSRLSPISANPFPSTHTTLVAADSNDDLMNPQTSSIPPVGSHSLHQVLSTRVLSNTTPSHSLSLLESFHDPSPLSITNNSIHLSSSQSNDHLSPTIGTMDSGNNRPSPRMKNEKYKTEICRSFAESSGFCKYGAKCQFAHGDSELRPVKRHPRYKTKLCRNFVTTGSCPYATRCRFIHASDIPLIHQNSLTQAAQKQLQDLATRMPAILQNMTGDPTHTEKLHHLLGYDPSQNYNAVIDSGHQPPNMIFPAIVSTTDLLSDESSPDWSHNFLPAKTSAEVLVEHSTPTDQVFHPNVNVFQDYSENHGSQSYLSLLGSGIGTSTAFSSSPFSEANPFSSTNTNQHPVGGPLGGTENVANLNVIAADENGIRQTSRFTHHASPLSLANKISDGNNIQYSPVQLKSERAEERVNPIITPVRSRLPLFRDLTSDPDSV